jgi:hypothetical protein
LIEQFSDLTVSASARAEWGEKNFELCQKVSFEHVSKPQTKSWLTPTVNSNNLQFTRSMVLIEGDVRMHVCLGALGGGGSQKSKG